MKYHPRSNRSSLYNKTGGFCYYCGALLIHPFDTDHIVPTSRGGSNLLENKVPSCRHCNSSKGSKTVEEFRRMLACRIRFSVEQISFLQELGLWGVVDKHIEERTKLIKFWYETHPTA